MDYVGCLSYQYNGEFTLMELLFGHEKTRSVLERALIEND